MFLGYGFGTLYKKKSDEIKRRKSVLVIGIAITLFFIVSKNVNAYGDPSHWTVQKNGLYTFLSFLNTTKYPPSLCYLSMTIGPILIFLLVIDTVDDKGNRYFKHVWQRAFLFLCVAFLPDILCVIAFFATGHTSKDIIDPNVPFFFRPQYFGFDLPVAICDLAVCNCNFI